jgi:hypothetical protein
VHGVREGVRAWCPRGCPCMLSARVSVHGVREGVIQGLSC